MCALKPASFKATSSDCRDEVLLPKSNRGSPFDFAQGRLSTALNYASLKDDSQLITGRQRGRESQGSKAG
jgi:hypothetical protein